MKKKMSGCCLKEACSAGNVEDIKYALTHLLPVDKETGETVLMKAIIKKNIELIKYLLDVMPKKLIMVETDNCERNAFDKALATEDEQIIDLLFPYADGTYKYNNGFNILMTAIYNKNDIKVIKKLISLVDINDVDNGGDTALHLACWFYLPNVVDLLLSEPKIDIAIIGKFSKTILHITAKEGHADLLEKILNKKPEMRTITWADQNGNTALHLAVRHNRYDCANLLAGLNNHRIVNNRGMDPIKVAIRMGDKKMIDMLWMDEDRSRDYPKYAKDHGFAEMAEHIQKKISFAETANNIAVGPRSTDGIKTANNIAIGPCGADGDDTANNIAVGARGQDLVEPTNNNLDWSLYISDRNQLFEYIKDLNVVGVKSIADKYKCFSIQRINGSDTTPLMQVAMISNVEYRNDSLVQITKMLMKKCDINAMDQWGITAIMFAIIFDNITVAELLVLESDLELKSIEGKTAYDYAVKRGYHKFAEKIKAVASLKKLV